MNNIDIFRFADLNKDVYNIGYVPINYYLKINNILSNKSIFRYLNNIINSNINLLTCKKEIINLSNILGKNVKIKKIKSQENIIKYINLNSNNETLNYIPIKV